MITPVNIPADYVFRPRRCRAEQLWQHQPLTRKRTPVLITDDEKIGHMWANALAGLAIAKMQHALVGRKPSVGFGSMEPVEHAVNNADEAVAVDLDGDQHHQLIAKQASVRKHGRQQ